MGVTTLGVRLGENTDGSDYPLGVRLGENTDVSDYPGSETRREHRQSLTQNGVEASAVPHSLAPVC